MKIINAGEKKIMKLKNILSLFLIFPITEMKNAAPDNKRGNTSKHEENNPHNYSLSFISIFFAVNARPTTAHNINTTVPASISIFCGNSPLNIPPKIKLANVNLPTSSSNLPRFSFVLVLALFTMVLLLLQYTTILEIKQAKKVRS